MRQYHLKSKRSTSNYSTSSHTYARSSAAAAAQQQQMAANGSAGLRASTLFSPMLSKKSVRYEDVEGTYDYIVEQEELIRLKQRKLLAKRRRAMRREGGIESKASENGSSDYSDDLDDDEDYIDDFDDSQDPLTMLDRDDLDDSGEPGIMDFSQFKNDEVVSQTITSDLDADLHSYKRMEAQEEATDDQDYLNGSTAGFGKKLRQINQEIYEEQQFQNEGCGYSTISSQVAQRIENSKKKQVLSAKKVKVEKQKFDLKLDQLKQNGTKHHTKLSADESIKKQSLLNSQALNVLKVSQVALDPGPRKNVKTV